MQKFLGFLTIVVLIVAIALVGREAINFLSSISDPVAFAAVIGSAGALLGAWYKSFDERLRAAREAHRERKIEVYSKFMSFITQVMLAAKDGNSEELLGSEKTTDFFIEFKRDIVLWSSPSVIRAFNTYMDNAGKSDAKALDSLSLMDKLLREFRKDLGLRNGMLAQGDLIRIFINRSGES